MLPLIQAGQLVNTLVSARTAKEYGITSTYAAVGEYLSSPVLAPGTLADADIWIRGCTPQTCTI